MDMTDTPFQICALRWDKLNAIANANIGLSVLSSYFGSMIVSCLSDDLLTIRRVAAFLFQLAVALPVFTFCYVKKIHLTRAISLTSAVSFIHCLFFSHTLSYNLFTVVALSLTIAAWLLYCHNTNILYLVLMGVFVALGIGLRFPNIIAVPVVLVAILTGDDYFHNKLWRKLLIHGAVFVSVFVACGALLSAFIFGESLGYIKSIDQAFAMRHSSYSCTHLLRCYLEDGVTMFSYISIIGFTYYFPKWFTRNRWIRVILLLLFSVLLAMHLRYNNGNYNWGVSLLMSSLLIVLLFVRIRSESMSAQSLVFAVACLFFSLIPAFGSDTGLLKVAWPIVLPVSLLSISVSCSIRWLIVPVAGILLYAPHKMLSFTYEDAGYPRLTSQVNHHKLAGVYTTKERSALIDNLQHKIIWLKKNHRRPLLMGHQRHMLLYLNDEIDQFPQHFKTTWDDEGSLMSLSSYLERINEDVCIILIKAPRHSLTVDLLNRHGYYESEVNEDYVLFTKGMLIIEE
jgi:hypothetical protein